MPALLKLRISLDEAITYGRRRLAKRLVTDGLRQARNGELLGEWEYFKGQAEILKGNYFEAIMHFDKAVAYNPSDGASYNDRALCMVELGLINEAFAYFDKGIEVEPDYATVYHNKGWLLNKVGRHKDAIEYFKKTLSLEPDRAVTYENLGDSLAHLEQYRASLAAYKKAIILLKGNASGIKRQLVSQMRRIGRKLHMRKEE
ncbi:MAG: tetratricopeptide repeat protein [Candidatus Omnitrophota bacterium]|jgi:tetratricopeptide (TPR) repeat protein